MFYNMSSSASWELDILVLYTYINLKFDYRFPSSFDLTIYKLLTRKIGNVRIYTVAV